VRLTENPLFLPHPDRSKPMAQDSRNIDNKDRGGGAGGGGVGATAGGNSAPAAGGGASAASLRIDAGRTREREDQQATAAQPNGENGGAQQGPNGMGAGAAGGQNQGGGGGMTQDSLSLFQLKRLVGENARFVVSLCGYCFPWGDDEDLMN
jgi:hypothetical protein